MMICYLFYICFMFFNRRSTQPFFCFLLQWRECNSEKHYMKGGKIGEFPAFSDKYIPGGKHFSSECIKGIFNFFPIV